MAQETSHAGVSTGVAIIGFILCFLSGGAVMWGLDSARIKNAHITAESGMGSGGSWADSESPIPVSSEDPTWGKRDAPVTMVVFSDFQCPFCSKVEPTIDQVKAAYGPDKLRIVWKNQPIEFHENARPAAEAAQAVFALKGSDAFWKFHDTAMKNQSSLGADSYSKWAAQAGVDPNAFKSELASKKASKKVKDDQVLASKIGANATPAFRINGAELSGAQPLDRFKEVIDKEMSKAKAKLAAGIAKDRVYVELSKENFKAPPTKPEPTPDRPREDTTTRWKVPVGASPQSGKKDAPVTIAIFSDFQCPFCKRGAETLKKLREANGDKIRVVWKNEPLPFHPRAEPASELALEARAQKGDKAFWDAHDKLFESAPKLEDSDLEKVAQDLGLDLDKVKTAIKTKKYAKEIEADVALSDDIEATSTPQFFINGRRIVGAKAIDEFQKIVDEELKAFDDAKGKVAPSEWYASITKDGKEAPPPEKKVMPPVPPGAAYKGNKDAKIVIEEWSDFQCPFCGRVEGSVAEIMKNYGDKVKFVWRDKPLGMHADAPLAAEIGREAMRQKGPDGFWKMHDKMMQNQTKLKRDDLEGYAKELGLDMAKVKTALDDRVHKAAVDADAKAASDIGIEATPAFLINGYVIDGALPYSRFKKVIDRALAETKK